MSSDTMAATTRRFAGIRVGQALPAVVKRPTTLQLFRYSAATWNAHLIHYDCAYAESEGYPGVLVQSHLHGCFLIQTALDWAGPGVRLRKFKWENRHMAVPGDVLTCDGRITATRTEGDIGVVECELFEHNQDGKLCAPGWAVLAFPLKEGDQA